MTEFSEQTFRSEDFTEASFKGHYYDECSFLNCDFTNAHFGQGHFENCTFESCNLNTVNVIHAKWQEITFRHCRLSGIDFENISKMLLSFSFENCQLTYSHFRGLKIPGTQFLNCEIKECDFVETDLSGVTFQGSTLSRSQFMNCDLSKADFRQAHDYSFDPWKNKITKAKFSAPEVLSFLTVFDIEIE